MPIRHLEERSLDKYFDSIRHLPLLTAEEERINGRLWQNDRNPEGLRRVVLVRPWGQLLPTHFDVELHSDSGDRLDARIKHVTPELRTALHQLGCETGNDWGPW